MFVITKLRKIFLSQSFQMHRSSSSQAFNPHKAAAKTCFSQQTFSAQENNSQLKQFHCGYIRRIKISISLRGCGKEAMRKMLQTNWWRWLNANCDR
jgi:hypothetical protein